MYNVTSPVVAANSPFKLVLAMLILLSFFVLSKNSGTCKVTFKEWYPTATWVVVLLVSPLISVASAVTSKLNVGRLELSILLSGAAINGIS